MTLTLITLITLFDAKSTAIIKVNVTKKAPIIGHINFNIRYLNIFSYTTDAPLKLNHGPVLHIRQASSPY